MTPSELPRQIKVKCPECGRQFAAKPCSERHREIAAGIRARAGQSAQVTGIKRCSYCRVVLSVENAAPDRRNPDGLGSECRECKRSRTRRRDATRAEEHRRSYLARRDDDGYRKRATDAQRRLMQRLGYKRKKPSPDKNRARRACMYAIKVGRLVRPSACGACGLQCKPDAHHADYSKPYDVTWLCRRCHGKAHRVLAMETPK